MLSGLLKSDIAVKVNIQVIDAFVKMRRYFANTILNNKILINHKNRILRLEKTFNKFKEILYSCGSSFKDLGKKNVLLLVNLMIKAT